MMNARSHYMTAAVATVGPAKLLTMLYDRMLLDVDRGAEALEAGDRLEASTHLQHAQEIIAELMSSLDPQAWEGGRDLMGIYTYLLAALVDASIKGDAAKARECRDLIEPLTQAWHDAARSLAQPMVPTQFGAPQLETATSVGLLGIG